MGSEHAGHAAPLHRVVNIGELLTIAGPPEAPLGIVHDAVVCHRGGRVVYAGPKDGAPPGAGEVIDAAGALVTPGLIDPHAHLVFAGSRAGEFDLRNRGKSYSEIQQAGGGILSTVKATRAASDEELFQGALARLDRFVSHGVTIVEAKSGYALSPDGELRLLRVIQRASLHHAIDLSPTLLLHVPSPHYDRKRLLDQFCHNVIGEAVRSCLADAVDIYCDEGAFTLDEARQFLEAGKRAGLLLRAHAEQFTHTGVAELAASLGARSVEHLEQLSAEAPAALARSGTVCNLLPGAALTLKLPWPDAGRLYAAGCRVALGTDCNPGSSLSESQPLMMSLACTQMGLSCEQAWLAVTREAAHAVARDDAGRLSPGARADLVVWNADDHRSIPQHLGASLVDQVLIRGRLAYRRATDTKRA